MTISDTKGQEKSFQNVFNMQVKESCTQEMKYLKSVREITDGSQNKLQQKVFLLDCNSGSAIDSETGEEYESMSLLDEVSYAVEKYALNPYVKAYYVIYKDSNHICAELKKGYEKKSPLKAQRIIMDEEGRIRRMESILQYDKRLYDIEIRICVWFDKAGKYQKHILFTSSGNLFQQKLVKTVIKGKRV